MRPLFIIVEGQTEQDFFRECLCPFWQTQYGLHEVYTVLLGTPGHKGGAVSATRISTDANRLLKQRPDALVSTFVDYYGIRSSIPNYIRCQTLPTANQRVACLEAGLAELIGIDRFIPYIQKHEFEALLFSQKEAGHAYFSQKLSQAIRQTASSFADPEEIDSDFPPSKRMASLFAEYDHLIYDKRVFGSILALEIGMPVILASCPRFASWVHSLAQLATAP